MEDSQSFVVDFSDCGTKLIGDISNDLIVNFSNQTDESSILVVDFDESVDFNHSLPFEFSPELFASPNVPEETGYSSNFVKILKK